MKISYQPIEIGVNKQELTAKLEGYWLENDIWDINSPVFDKYRPEKLHKKTSVINFAKLSAGVKEEIKYYFMINITSQKMSLNLAIHYGLQLSRFSRFLKTHYPKMLSLTEVAPEKLKRQWTTYLISEGAKINKAGKLSNNYYESMVNQLIKIIFDFYDTRDEFEKDIWDCRKIPGARIGLTNTGFLLNFFKIPIQFRDLAKRYLKVRIVSRSWDQCYVDLQSLKLFFTFLVKNYPNIATLSDLNRSDFENYFAWFKNYTKGWKKTHIDYFVSLKLFVSYIQLAEYSEAPIKDINKLIFEEDFPKKKIEADENIKYIPDGVIIQLEKNIDKIEPPDCIPIVILLRASGWRISDILNLKYNECLQKTSQGWYLCGDIVKTEVMGHRIPITDEVAAIVKVLIEEVKEKSTKQNNPYRLLFVRLKGRRIGKPPTRSSVSVALNRLANKYEIVDDQGKIFKFGNHAFRHTKAIELINNGMNLLHVQKWMAHASPEMTLRYARILDTTMRKSWEEVARQRIFKIDDSGNIRKIDISDIENENVIEWEYIRYNLDAVRMPLGYCMKPKKQECHTQLNPCLTCRNLCTTAEFIPQYEFEICETKALIERGKIQNRTVWVEKNQALLEKYETVLEVLKTGSLYHKAGKKGREYVGEERKNDSF